MRVVQLTRNQRRILGRGGERMRRSTHEEWGWVPGYEGRYQVSTHARVRSMDRYVTIIRFYRAGRIVDYSYLVFLRGKILKETSAYSVRLFRDGEVRSVSPRVLCYQVWGISFPKRSRGDALHPRLKGNGLDLEIRSGAGLGLEVG